MNMLINLNIRKYLNQQSKNYNVVNCNLLNYTFPIPFLVNGDSAS